MVCTFWAIKQLLPLPHTLVDENRSPYNLNIKKHHMYTDTVYFSYGLSMIITLKAYPDVKVIVGNQLQCAHWFEATNIYIISVKILK